MYTEPFFSIYPGSYNNHKKDNFKVEAALVYPYNTLVSNFIIFYLFYYIRQKHKLQWDQDIIYVPISSLALFNFLVFNIPQRQVNSELM